MALKDTLSFSPFMYEQLACGGKNQLQISSVCNANCLFCSNNQNPFKIKRIGFRPVDEIKKALHFIDQAAQTIIIGDALPGRISEGEALLHPDLFEILYLIRKHTQSPISLATNGILLTKEFVNELARFGPFIFTLSYHVHDEDYWCKIFDLKEDKYKIAVESFDVLRNYGCEVKTITVPLPNLVGYDNLEKTVEFLGAKSNSQIVYFPGYTNKTPKSSVELMQHDKKELTEFYKRMVDKYQVNLRMFDPHKFNLFDVMKSCSENYYRNIYWFFSEAGYLKGKEVLDENKSYFPGEHTATCVKNYTYGGNIDCAGLLMVSDFRRTMRDVLETTETSPDLFIIPRLPFDSFKDDLCGENIETLIKEFAPIDIWLK